MNHNKPIKLLALCLCLGFALLCLATQTATADKPQPQGVSSLPSNHAELIEKGLVIFKKHVRPVLMNRCVGCHGKDDIEGEFNLATRKGLLAGGASGPAVIVSKSNMIAFKESKNSLLYRLITHAEQPHMPYEEDKLSEAAIRHIAEWIDYGAPYDKPLVAEIAQAKDWRFVKIAETAREFWSFRPLKQTLPPEVKAVDRCQTPIDRFILARLEAKGISLNGDADRRRLIRRAYFSLLGLPPDAIAVEEFLADDSPNAYEKLIDRLLANPHYGERWGRHWLDLARFAESHGFEHDYDRKTAYHYRDFVIRALNDDLPYNTFIKWQLAGDEFAPDNNLAMMATGFLAAGVHSTQITKNEVERHRYDELDDIVSTTGTAMLGLTLGCARCHEHKFDPIPQGDYYRLLSAFRTTVRSEVDLDFDPQGYKQAKAVFDKKHAPLAATLKKFETAELPARLAAWEKTNTVDDLPSWLLLEPTSQKSAGGVTFTRLDDGSLLAQGKNANFDTYTLVVRTNVLGITAVRLEALSHPSMVKNGPGRAKNGNFDLTDFQVTAAPASQKGATPTRLKLTNPRATFEQKGLPIQAAIDDNKKSGWAVDPQFGKDHAASFELETPVGFEGGTLLTFTLKFAGNTGHNIGRLRLSVTTAAKPVGLDGGTVPVEIVNTLNTPLEKRSAKQQSGLLKWFAPQDADWTQRNQAVQQHLKQAPKPNLVKVLVSSEGLPAIRLHSQGADFFEESYYLRRGNTKNKRGIASMGFLQVLMTTPDEEKHWPVKPPQGARTSFRRTSLSNWMTDPQQGAGHLLARVIVNRLWQHHFGKGIVTTPSDFGARGERPTHPELLDWLASELIRNDWRLKPIHKLIMLSSVYRQTSVSDTKKLAVDNGNRLFWRFTPRRLEGEVIRDSLLAVSGEIDSRMFGPGTLDENSQRRSIYFTVKRSQLIPMMQVFDAPDALSGSGQRPSTTIAPQALLLMNSPHVRHAVKAFALRVLKRSESSDDSQIRNAYQVAVGRGPTAAELADAVAFIRSQAASYATAGKSGSRKLALADFCQVLICLNEFVYVE